MAKDGSWLAARMSRIIEELFKKLFVEKGIWKGLDVGVWWGGTLKEIKGLKTSAIGFTYKNV